MMLGRSSCLVAVLLLLPIPACSEGPLSEPAAEPVQRPDTNILLITLDTLRADYLHCYGKTDISTPAIDALAARGVRFSQAVAQVPLTAPSHASILTGTYPQIHGIRDMGGFVLDNQVPTLAESARRAGLDTAAFVAAAVLHHHYGLNRGFETYNDEMGAQASQDKLPGVVAEVRGEVITERAIQWLKERPNQTKPFFLWVHYYDPHFPYDPPGQYKKQYSKDVYAGEVAYTDAQVGALLSFLSYQGLAEKTLVVLLADHGESLGEHGEQTHGVFLYDSTLHVPLLVAGPGVPQGRVIAQQVRSIDVLPTILDYLGLAAGERVQGASLRPAIQEGKPVRTNYSYMETLYPKIHHGWSELRGMRTDEWKLILAPQPELYRFSDDRDESQNMVSRFPAEADRLQKHIWEITGPPASSSKVEFQPVDEETLERLRSLGYVSAGAPRELRFDFSGPDPKDRVHVLRTLDRVIDLMNHDGFAAAVPLLQKLVKEDSGDPLIYQHLGLCHQRLGQFRKAQEVYDLAVKNGADTDQTHAELGEIYVRFGELEKAVEAMEKAGRLNPLNLDNFSNLANAYLQLGRPEDAKRAVSAIFTKNRRHGAGNNLMGLIEIHKGRPVQARPYFEQAVSSNPEMPEPYMNLGLLAQRAGERAEALRYFRLFLAKATGPQYRDIVPKVKAAIADLERGS